MQKAMNKHGNFIILFQESERNIIQWKQNKEPFYCPTCNSKVIIRSGRKVIAHFSHLPHSFCRYGNGEGMYHEMGKYLLYQWLTDQNIEVDLEVYFPKINRRADLVIKVLNKIIIIEFQCAKISAEEIAERTSAYNQINLHIIWIVGMNQFRRLSNNQFKLSSFLQSCIHLFPQQKVPVLYFFDPTTRHFASLSHIYPYQFTKAFATINIAPIQTIPFQRIFKDIPISLRFPQVWIEQLQQIRNKPIIHPGKEMNWRRKLYEQGIIFHHLPSICFLPNKWQIHMNTPFWMWQTEIIINLIQDLSISATLTISRCAKILDENIIKQLPNIHQKYSAIHSFLTNLEILGYLKKTSNSTYVKLKNVEMYVHLEDALKGDEKIITQLFLEKKGKM
ncbi:competence protein CoiA family protein [Oceanobacillus kimchii]|uniref:competence protein CoiA family protein n=1 Tax=Oceanobacillus kimchii TaxID=746691 RepID=UPI002330B10B|nr:competence protein CoiA family protein [Oceanobacillus kimchii]